MGPAFGGDAVEACDHGDVDGRDRALQQVQVALGADAPFDHGRKVIERFGEALGRVVDKAVGLCGSLSHLLLEQREHHDRANTAVRQSPDAVERVRQRRWGRHERVAQRQTHIFGREVHHSGLRGSDGIKPLEPRRLRRTTGTLYFML